ncbi:MAG TPA: protein kinase [Roseiflexaceae bacterium]|nr:protein kinase [Roseiflexaceae bacterium]
MSNVPQRIGNYRIERQIGRGGTSHVLLGRHTSLDDRLVAVKLLLSQESEAVERFRREANIASRLRHEHIVQIYDHGYHSPYHYAVMEYVAGGSLRGQLKEGRALPLDTTMHIVRCTAEALDYSHAHGVIHRDVSPGNILLEQGTSRVLLTDFGIAREAGKSNVTTVGNVMGTPGYLSPEHAVSATAVTHLSDIFSLGVVLYEMLCGKLPWDHYPGMSPENNGGPFDPPKLLRERGAEVPNDVDRVIRTMLALDPAKRYPSALAAVEDLERILQRHTTATVVVARDGSGKRRSASAGRTTIAQAVAAPTVEQELHPVERALSMDLLKAPMLEARQRADQLSDPLEVAALLDRWAAAGRFRQRLLGRQATLRRVQSFNVYYYTLRTLYEHRGAPREVLEPDYKAAQIKLEKEVDRWAIDLGSATEFKDDAGGTIRMPGSVRVTLCNNCGGVGRTICETCEGRGRVVRSPEAPQPAVARERGGRVRAAVAETGGDVAVLPPAKPAGPTLVPCGDCGGSGGLRCTQCDGVGRMLQHASMPWSRKAETFDSQDNLPRVDENWLRRNCKMREVYCEQQAGGFRPEWLQVPVLNELIEQARAKEGDHMRVVLSEVQIQLIPVTEIVFDLGVMRSAIAPPTARAKKGAAALDKGLYSWYIYGFENLLPQDWRFLNWDRVLWMAFALLALVLFVLLLLAFGRMGGML